MGDSLLILTRCSLRHWRLAWRQQVVLLGILALGTAVFVAIRLANAAALSGFERFADGVTQQPDWTVQSPGGPLPMAALADMRAALGSRPVHLIPVLEVTVSPGGGFEGQETEIGGGKEGAKFEIRSSKFEGLPARAEGAATSQAPPPPHLNSEFRASKFEGLPARVEGAATSQASPPPHSNFEFRASNFKPIGSLPTWRLSDMPQPSWYGRVSEALKGREIIAQGKLAVASATLGQQARDSASQTAQTHENASLPVSPAVPSQRDASGWHGALPSTSGLPGGHTSYGFVLSQKQFSWLPYPGLRSLPRAYPGLLSPALSGLMKQAVTQRFCSLKQAGAEGAATSQAPPPPHSNSEFRASNFKPIGSLPTWRLLGMDLVGLLNLSTAHFGPAGKAPSQRPVFAPAAAAQPLAVDQSKAVYISEVMGRRLGVSVGDELPVVVQDSVQTLVIGGLIAPPPDAPQPPDNVLLMSLEAVQALSGQAGKLSRVEVMAERGGAFPNLREETGALLEAAARGRWQVLRQEDRRAQAGTMTAGFRLNLTILSLLALLVGGYLIFQALDGIVLRRREEIAVLKALGIADGSIARAFLAEAAVLGLVGGVLGTLLGWAGAQLAVGGVARTVTALYGASSASSAPLPWQEWLLGVLLSLAASLVAAWWPARQAALTPPAWMLSRQRVVATSGRLWGVEWLGWALMLVGVALSLLGPLRLASGLRISLAGYLAALAWLLGAGLAAGSLLRWLARLLRPTGAVARVAVSHLRQPSVRHRFALAALVTATAMTAGMAVLVGSFDATMRSWIERSMKADLFIASAGAQSASSTSQISADTVAKLRALPEVAELAATQNQSVQLIGGPAWVLGVEAAFGQKHELLTWAERPGRDDWWRLPVSAGSTPALVSESFSERFQRHRGDGFDVPTPSGSQRVEIVGVYADYGNERGSLSVPAEVFRQWFGHGFAWRIAVMLRPGSDAEALRERMLQQHPGLAVYTNAHLRAESLRIFRQTFSVTYAMQAVGVLVAVTGLGLALASLLLERREDLATLRSLGMTRREIAQAEASEGTALAACGVAVGLGSGLWLGWLLIHVVNKQTFGWTLGLVIPAGQLLALGLAIIVVGGLVAAFASLGRSSE